MSALPLISSRGFSASKMKASAWCWGFFVLLLGSGTAETAFSSPSAAAIATAHPAATRAGMTMLEAGGNAFDAAVAVSAALAVVEPYSSGLGGGGFWLLQRARDGREVMIDGRERAPFAASKDMYLDSQGAPIANASIDGPLAAGIPGEVAALVHIARHYGRLPLKQSFAPAIELAQEGFAVDEHYRRMAGFRLQALKKSPGASKIFLKAGEVPPVGHIIRQPDLANTLRGIAVRGNAGFYRGAVATRMISSVRRQGGVWTRRDLLDYRIMERRPVVGHYRGWRVVSAAPPSSGGILLVEMLNMLSRLDLKTMSRLDRIHHLVEVMRRAYRDRALWLGDADYVQIPLKRLLSPTYATKLLATLNPKQASRSEDLQTAAAEGHDTTHFSILDTEGNRVAATLSINYPFGSGFVAEGTGVLLNDEMDDFSMKPGVANVYGLVGGQANAIQPGKRMLSSMSPTILENEDQVAILGTPGGSRIISMVLLAILEVVEDKEVRQWVKAPRFHHQYLPDEIQLEADALSAELQQQLLDRGHKLNLKTTAWGNMQAIHWDKKRNRVQAASDPRGNGMALVKAISNQPGQR